MGLARSVLAAACLAALAIPALAAASPGLEIRTDDTVFLKDGGRLEGEVQSENERELRIMLKGSRVIRTESMANVERILRKQNIKQAFDARFKECTDRKDPVGLRDLAADVLALNPGMLDEATSALVAACGLRPDYGPAHLLLGRLYLQKGFAKKAGEEGDAAVKTLPDNAEAYVLQGTALVRQGEAKKAVAALDKALALKPSTDDQIGAAAALAEAGELDRAQELLAKLTETNPAAQLAAGVAWLRAGKLDQAAGLLDKTVQALKGQAEPHLALAATYYLQGETDKAAQELNELPTHNDARDAAPLALKGLVALRRGETDRAEAFLKRATVADPNRGRVAAARAVLELSRNNLDEAVGALEAPAGDASCADGYVHYLLGYVLYRKADFPKALAAYSRAAELTPAWPDARLGAGASALAGRNFRSAAEHFDAAAKLAPDSAAAHVGLGLACLGVPGRDDDADRELRRALTLDPRCVHAYLGLGFLANKRKVEVSALTNFERAIGLDGSNAYAADALKALRAGRGEEVQYFAFDGPGLPAGWASEQLYGVQVSAADGRVLLAGRQKRTGGRETRFFLRLEPGKFVRLDLDVECAPTGGLVAGLYLAGGNGDLELAMIETGRLAWRRRNRSGWSNFEEVGEWPKGEAGAVGKVRLAIELVEPDQGTFRLYAGGRPVSDKEISVDTLARAPGFMVGAFCRAALDEDVKVGLDNACLVTKKPKPDENK